MAHGIPESDWKIFRTLRESALERFCERALDDADRIRRDDSKTHHERYLEVFRLIQERDADLAQAFDGPRRSRMLWQLTVIHGHGLLEPDELARFTPETRQAIAPPAGSVSR